MIDFDLAITGLTLIMAYMIFNKIFTDIKNQEIQDRFSKLEKIREVIKGYLHKRFF